MNQKIKKLILKHYEGTCVAEDLDTYNNIIYDYEEVWQEAQKELLRELIHDKGFHGLIEYLEVFNLNLEWERKNKLKWEGKNK